MSVKTPAFNMNNRLTGEVISPQSNPHTAIRATTLILVETLHSCVLWVSRSRLIPLLIYSQYIAKAEQ